MRTDGNAARYAESMTIQIAVKLSNQIVAAIDELIAEGRYDSRSAAVRAGLDMVTRQARAERIDRAFTDGFRRMPERPEELREARRLAIEAIDDEPWEKWW
jgi:Arc/MetJ-type ribon-helix-helix transcriptional regulator